MRRATLALFLAILTLTVLTSGCGIGKRFFGKRKPDKAPEEMAKEGIEELRKKNYIDAAETFSKIKDRYPYSEQAIMAQLKVADAYYYDRKFDEAQAAYKEFEKLHPTNKAIPYVIYQQALCFYRQRPTIDRDQTFTEKALEEFRRLQKKFPQSAYAAKAEKYMARCLDDLAQHEFYVGEFYFKTKHYASALDRFQALSQEYPDFKPAEVKNYIKQCEGFIANPQTAEGFFSRLFDAKW
jgi:outer membrane protein assembly factor BamD|uniref:Outer membrane protein assembly factor BamD n=1 Tax=Desulfobacca acetoxidans TaxID=60893 RepID=A0A7C3UWA6_9BACT